MSDSPVPPARAVHPRRQNPDSVLLYFYEGTIIFGGPLHQNSAVRDRIGVEGSDRFAPFVLVEIYLPDGDTFLPPAWMDEVKTSYSLSPEGICLSPIIDRSQAVSESVPLGAVDSLPANAGNGRYWVVPPKLIGFSVFLPRRAVLTFERYAAGSLTIREHAFSVKWENGELFHSFTPKRIPSPPAEAS